MGFINAITTWWNSMSWAPALPKYALGYSFTHPDLGLVTIISRYHLGDTIVYDCGNNEVQVLEEHIDEILADEAKAAANPNGETQNEEPAHNL